MSSKITTDSLMHGELSVQRGEVYRALKEKGIDIYPGVIDADLEVLEEHQILATITTLISGILLIFTLCMHATFGGAFTTLFVSLETLGTLAGLAVFAVESLKKRNHLKEEVSVQQVNKMLEQLKNKIAQKRVNILNSDRMQRDLLHITALEKLNSQILLDQVMEENSPQSNVADSSVHVQIT